MAVVAAVRVLARGSARRGCWQRVGSWQAEAGGDCYGDGALHGGGHEGTGGRAVQVVESSAQVYELGNYGAQRGGYADGGEDGGVHGCRCCLRV